MPCTAIILAAGEGTRMKSRHPKVLHNLLNLPLLGWVLRAVRLARVDRIVVVVGSGSDEVRAYLSDQPDVECVEQTKRLGTGHAVRTVLDAAQISEGTIVILNGDLPLVAPETIASLSAAISSDSPAALLAMQPDNPFGYGRLDCTEDGYLRRIVEQKDCTEAEARELTLCNAGCYAFDAQVLNTHISELSNDNAQQEYYLTDMVAILGQHGYQTRVHTCADPAEGLGVNSQVQLAELSALAQKRINTSLMEQGVSFLDPTSVWVGPDVQVARDTCLLPMTMLWGKTSIGEGCIIGPNTRLDTCTVGNDCRLEETVATHTQVGNRVTCGPRCYLRPGTELKDGSHVGTHVEIKNSTVSEGAKVPHLSYIGDTFIGERTNIGAGSITCNYDGVHKHRTHIGNDVFIGSDTMMVAPLTIGDGALVGASSCITSDVPAHALALERSDIRIVPEYAQTRLERLRKEDVSDVRKPV